MGKCSGSGMAQQRRPRKMHRNSGRSWLRPVVVAAAATAFFSLQFVIDAQEQAPAPAAPAAGPARGGGQGGGVGRGGGRGFGPTMKPSALRAIPAETTAAKAKD